MFRVNFSALTFGVLSTLILLLTGCSSTPEDRTARMSPNAIYAEAQDAMADAQWDKAIPLLEKLEARAAGTPLAQQAQLDKAYAHYKTGEAALAIVTLERFMRLHPASPALDYALYLKGLVNFNEDLGLFASLSAQDLSERDQKASKESFESFKELITRFPKSKYASDARQRMTYIVNSLAEYEVHVARYYLTRKAYVAAINRAQTAITDYPSTPAVEKALGILYQAYDALQLVQLRDDAKRVLIKNYPQSELLRNGDAVYETSPWWKFW